MNLEQPTLWLVLNNGTLAHKNYCCMATYSYLNVLATTTTKRLNTMESKEAWTAICFTLLGACYINGACLCLKEGS